MQRLYVAPTLMRRCINGMPRWVMMYDPSEDSDQPVYPFSLICLKVSLGGQQTARMHRLIGGTARYKSKYSGTSIIQSPRDRTVLFELLRL